tara:strand:- start:1963 stop:2115 length:153 start_codon:yes stop_codon:yes gene_type:complete
MLDILLKKMSQIKEVIDNLPDGQRKDEILILQGEFANEFIGYLKYLEIEQ